MRAATLVPVVLLLLTAAGCSDDKPSGKPPTVARAVVEQQITERLGDETGQEPEQVGCPDDLLGEVGEEMRCTITVAGDDPAANPDRTVVITVNKVVGQEVRFDIDVEAAS